MREEVTTRLTLNDIPSATVEPVVLVKATDTLTRARTLMELHDFSQLPVVRGKGTIPVGVVSWLSIGKTLSRIPNATLSDCIAADAPKHRLSDELLPTIPTINRHGFVLVVRDDRSISGIVTSADIGDKLVTIAQPFLLVQECERRLRAIISTLIDAGLVKKEELASRIADENKRDFGDPSDLTFGDVCAIVKWKNTREFFGSNYDFDEVGNALDKVAALRNALMHFRVRELEHDQAEVLLPHLNEILRNIQESIPGIREQAPSST